MRQKRKTILVILCGTLLLGLLVWQFWPRSLAQICGLDFDQAISLSADTAVTRFELVETIFARYKLDGESTAPGGEHFAPLLEQFKAIKARPSQSNLLRPWLLSEVSWYGNVDFVYGFVNCGESAVSFTLTDRGELIVNSRLYFITNESKFNTLWHYVTTYGEKTEN